MKKVTFPGTVRGAALAVASGGFGIGLLYSGYAALFWGSKVLSLSFIGGAVLIGAIIAGGLVAAMGGGRGALGGEEGSALAAFLPPGARGGDPVREVGLLLGRLQGAMASAAGLVEEIYCHHATLTESSRQTVEGNERQAAKARETFASLEAMNAYFNELLRDIEDLAQRTEERASISTEMSATTDSIAASVKDYSTSVLETSASIEEMVLSIKETAANVAALAASTEQTSDSIKQIGTAISGVRDNARKTADCSEKVRLQAIEGMEAMGISTTAILDIEQTTNDSFSAIKRLALHTSRIGEFLNIIKDLVDQTNLLSLNASIIAAQAGDRGKSFTVVAEEVRALARRTSASTKEIEELVKNIQKETTAVENAVTVGKEKVGEGVKKVAGANATLKRIEESAAEAATMVQKIAAATVDQAAGSRLITEEAEKNLVRVQQVTRAVEELERGTSIIVNTLEYMRALSQKITTSTEEQSRGNRLYLKSVLEDNDRVKALRETSIQQIMMGDVLLNEMRASGSLIEGNTDEIKQMIAEVEVAMTLMERLRTELASFSS